MNDEKAEILYADIIDLPYRKSRRHTPMSNISRAAAFAPFAALSGYDDMVREQARLTDSKVDLSEYEIDRLNRQLCVISNAVQNGTFPLVTVTFFLPDAKKDGGSYLILSAKVKAVDPISQTLSLFSSSDTSSKRTTPLSIPFSHLLSIDDEV